MTPADFLPTAGGALSGGVLAWYLIRREVDKLDALGKKVQAIEVSIAGSLMTKDDADHLGARLDALAATLDMVKDMVTRLDEREKVRHEQRA